MALAAFLKSSWPVDIPKTHSKVYRLVAIFMMFSFDKLFLTCQERIVVLSNQERLDVHSIGALNAEASLGDLCSLFEAFGCLRIICGSLQKEIILSNFSIAMGRQGKGRYIVGDRSTRISFSQWGHSLILGIVL